MHSAVSKYFVMNTAPKVLCVGWDDTFVSPDDDSLTRLENNNMKNA